MLKKILKKKDIWLVSLLIILGIISYFAIEFVFKKDGSVVSISIDGKVSYELNLYEDDTITVDGYNGGENIVVIKDGSVCMSDADCPDKLCVNMGKISKTGETIVCLPHRVVVEIKGNKRKLDSIVK